LNVLLTGSNGFLAKEIKDFFSKLPSYNLILTNRKNLDVTDPFAVDKFFKDYQIDIVIHTAVCGGKRGRVDTIDDLFNNIKMFDNLSRHSDKFKMMINFGSGAEFDRQLAIYNASEDLIYKRLPNDYYGLSKNLITKKILDFDSNIINLRLFGCFGIHESSQRLIKNTINKFKNKTNAEIHGNLYIDYIYSVDVCRIIEFFINNHQTVSFRDLNLCYTPKQSIKDIVFLIKDLTNSSYDVILNKKTSINHYTGNNDNLQSLGIPLLGFNKGLEEVINKS
jgi:nucleoside-diphosphate-sugar epimerase